MRVAIVGGGVAGLAAAYFLRRGGADVTVLESNRVGSAASAGNAGWLSPAQAGPLPEPGLAAYGVRSLVQRDSPLYFAPSHLPRMAWWLARFALRCNERDFRRGTEALARLGRRTFELTELLHDDGVEFEIHRRGLLLAAERREGAEAFLRGLEPLRALGYRIPGGVMDGAAVRELEPMLSHEVSAGLLIEEHWHVHPPTLARGLAVRLRGMGVDVEEGAEALGLEASDGRVRGLRTAAGDFGADAIVLAAGAWTPALARQLGLRVPVEAGKGYSFELRLDPLPARPLLLLEPHVGCTPFGDRLRIAGTMEFSGVNTRIDRRRIDGIVRGAARLLPAAGAAELERPWGGMRPIAPDGLPIVDRAPGHANVYLATAYSMLGMTLAAPAGEALAGLILTGRRPPELEPFGADRFGWPGRRPA